MNFDLLIESICFTNNALKLRVSNTISQSLTIRNWLVGYYIIEFEQNGLDRAKYGNKLMPKIAASLKEHSLKGFSTTNLRLCGQFYRTYPNLDNAFASNFTKKINLPSNFRKNAIHQTSDELESLSPQLLLNKLTFSHFIELLKVENPLKRSTLKDETIVKYATQGIDNQLFVSKYMLQLPSEKELAEFIEKEKEHFEQSI